MRDRASKDNAGPPRRRPPSAAVARGVVAAWLFVLAAAPSARAGHRAERAEKRTVPVSGERVLVVENTRGRTSIAGVAETDLVTVVATRRVHGRDAAAVERLLEKLDVDIESRGGEMIVTARLPRRSGDRGVWSLFRGEAGSGSIDLDIKIPASFDLRAAATSGDVRVTGLGGEVRAIATSGEITLREIGGDVRVSVTSGGLSAGGIGGGLEVTSTSGDVRVDGVGGVLSIAATSGDAEVRHVDGDAVIHLIQGELVLDGCGGNIELTTSTGDAEMRGVQGWVQATSSSGDLDVAIVPDAVKSFVFNTSSGDVDLHYDAPRGYGFRLLVNTGSGSIRGDMNIRVEEITRRTLRGIVGGGVASVVVATASGNVSIVEATGRQARKSKGR